MNVLKSNLQRGNIIEHNNDMIHQEIVILCLLLLLVIYSISMFINNWSRNYRDITQPAFMRDQEEDEESEDPEAAHLTASKRLPLNSLFFF